MKNTNIKCECGIYLVEREDKSLFCPDCKRECGSIDNLNLEKAEQLMHEGYKMSNHRFSREEYIHMKNNQFTTEDGYPYPIEDLLDEGNDYKYLLDGWRIWKDPKAQSTGDISIKIGVNVFDGQPLIDGSLLMSGDIVEKGLNKMLFRNPHISSSHIAIGSEIHAIIEANFGITTEALKIYFDLVKEVMEYVREIADEKPNHDGQALPYMGYAPDFLSFKGCEPGKIFQSDSHVGMRGLMKIQPRGGYGISPIASLFNNQGIDEAIDSLKERTLRSSGVAEELLDIQVKAGCLSTSLINVANAMKNISSEYIPSDKRLSSKKLKKLWNEAKKHNKSYHEIKELQEAYITAKREGR